MSSSSVDSHITHNGYTTVERSADGTRVTVTEYTTIEETERATVMRARVTKLRRRDYASGARRWLGSVKTRNVFKYKCIIAATDDFGDVLERMASLPTSPDKCYVEYITDETSATGATLAMSRRRNNAPPWDTN